MTDRGKLWNFQSTARGLLESAGSVEADDPDRADRLTAQAQVYALLAISAAIEDIDN